MSITTSTSLRPGIRDAYNANIEEAEKEWGRRGQKERDQILGHLESRALMVPFTSQALHLDMQMQYSFDYCQQVSLPYSSQQRGTFYFRTPRKVQVFGVCCEPLCRQVFFLIDEAEQAGKGAVVVVSLVHAFFHLHGLGERRVTLQADNCVGQNKNTTMMWYLAWRVITGQHDTIQLNFMLPGHTKFRPDSYFGLFKKYYRRQDHVDDMDDLADCVRSVARTSLVCHNCTRTGSTMTGMPSWASGLGLWLALAATIHLSLTENTLVSWKWRPCHRTQTPPR